MDPYVYRVQCCLTHRVRVNRFVRLCDNPTENKQDRQHTYNVTLRRFRATTFAVEEKYVLHILIAYL
jgi:hypothetical protein